MIYLEHLLKYNSFSSQFSKETLKKCCKIVEEIFFYDKEVIFDEANDELNLFIILEGKVSMSVKLTD